jgi:type 1 fimbria pilin
MSFLRTLALATIALTLPASALATLNSGPVILDIQILVNNVPALPLAARMHADGSTTLAGQPGTWTYDAAARELTLDYTPVLVAVGERQGRCFEGTATLTMLPTIPIPWRGCRR